jgi:hypothetical protein
MIIKSILFCFSILVFHSIQFFIFLFYSSIFFHIMIYSISCVKQYVSKIFQKRSDFTHLLTVTYSCSHLHQIASLLLEVSKIWSTYSIYPPYWNFHDNVDIVTNQGVWSCKDPLVHKSARLPIASNDDLLPSCKHSATIIYCALRFCNATKLFPFDFSWLWIIYFSNI